MSRGNRLYRRLAVMGLVSAAAFTALPALPASAVARSVTDTCQNAPNTVFEDENQNSAEINTAADCSSAIGYIKGKDVDNDNNPEIAGSDPTVRSQSASILLRLFVAAGGTVQANPPDAFDDDDALPDAIELEVNQAAAANLINGKNVDVNGDGDTPDLDPNDNLTRGQQIVGFINLLEARDPNGTPNSGSHTFPDVPANHPFNTQIGIADDLGIIQGGADGRLNPEADVSRGNTMVIGTRVADVLKDAGFLAAPGASGVQVTPDTAATQADGTARSFSATTRNADGTNYAGQVIIDLFDANANGGPNLASPATCAFIQQVDTTVLAGPNNSNETTFAGTDGKVDFIIRDNAGGATCSVVARVVADADTDGVVDTGEQRDNSGQTTFPFVPAEAANGSTSNQTICAITRTAGSESFVGDNGNGCGGGAPDDLRFDVDNNDIFLGGEAANFAAFVAQMSVGDGVAVNNYQRDAAGQSTFQLTNVIQPLVVNTPTTPQDAATTNLAGTGEGGFTVTIYRDVNPDGDADPDNDYQNGTDQPLGSVVVGEDGKWATTAPLLQNALNNFVAVQRPAGQNDATAVPAGNVARDTEGEITVQENTGAARPRITAFTGANAGPSSAGQLTPDDTITVTANEAINFAANATLTLRDPDGTETVLTRGAQFQVTAGNNTATVTLTMIGNPVGSPAGTTGGIQPPAELIAISGVTAVSDGVVINLGASTDKVLEGF